MSDKPIHCYPPAIGKIPAHLENLRITYEDLKARGACDDGLDIFKRRFPNGCTYRELRQKIAEKQFGSYEQWLQFEFGGDEAFVAESDSSSRSIGAAISGVKGKAVSECYAGAAVVGTQGAAVCTGEASVAFVNSGGYAIAGVKGVAVTFKGVASALEGGVLVFFRGHGDPAVFKVGENGVEAGKFYHLNPVNPLKVCEHNPPPEIASLRPVQ